MVRVIGHRGFSGDYPENTITAFRKALEIGVDEIEFDVRIAKDGHLIIIHDETVTRTTDGKGNVADMTFEEIKELDAGSWFDPAYEGIRIPTFEEGLENIPDTVELNIHTLPHPVVTEKIISALIEHGRTKTSYIAIEPAQIPLARKMYGEIRLCNIKSQIDPEEYVEETKKWNCERLQFFAPAYEVSKKLIEKAHSYGIFVNVFYADEKEDMEQLIRNGADAILTNKPDLLMRVRRGQVADKFGIGEEK